MVPAQILILVVFCLVLIKSTEAIIVAIKHLARRLGVSSFGITAFILAFATSLPELIVGITASLEGLPEVVVGNVLGSNIADISLVIGGAAIAGGMVKVTGKAIKRDMYLVFGAAMLPVLLLEDLVLSRSDGIVLLAVYLFFVVTVLRGHAKEVGRHAFGESPMHRLLLTVTRKGGRGDFVKFVLGVTGLLISSHGIVQLAKVIASGLGVPIILIGLFLVAVGTSLPELVFEMRAVLAGKAQMALGDLLGSVVANATLILGISAIITPVRLTNGMGPYLTAIGAFILLYGMFFFFSRTKGRLSRGEALLMVVVYAGFVLLELGRV